MTFVGIAIDETPGSYCIGFLHWFSLSYMDLDMSPYHDSSIIMLDYRDDAV